MGKFFDKINAIPRSFFGFFFMIIVYLFGIVFYYKDSISVATKPIVKPLFLMLFITSLILMIGFFILMKFTKLRIEVFASAILLILGSLYMMVFTPMSVPDEPTHYATAYKESNTLNFKNFDNDKIYMRECDKELFASYDIKVSIDRYSRIIGESEFLSDENEYVQVEATTVPNRFMAYLPQAFGLAVGKAMHLGAYPTYYLGRFTNLLLFVILIFFSIKITPIGKSAMAIGSLLPMTLHMAASYSYDIFSIEFFFLISAIILNLIYNEDARCDNKKFLILCILTFIAEPAKLVYIVVPALILLVPKKKFKYSKYHLLYKFGLMAVAAISALIFFGSLSNTGTVKEVETYSVSKLLSEPLQMVSVYFRSFIINADFYIRSFFGYSLAWFQVEIPMYAIYAFGIILMISFMRTQNETISLKPIPRIYVVLLVLASSLLILTALLLDYTPYPLGYAYGVQGRYWLPLIPLFMLIVRNDWIVIKQGFEKKLVYTVFFLNLWVLIKYYIAIVNAG